jgi:hypothetical protein
MARACSCATPGRRIVSASAARAVPPPPPPARAGEGSPLIHASESAQTALVVSGASTLSNGRRA